MNTETTNTATSLPPQVDIAIVGGGMVGLSLAAILAAAGDTLSIAVVEAADLGAMAGDTTPVDRLPPSFDARSTALSASTRQIYLEAGLWPQLAACACPIAAIHVSDRGHPGATRMSAGDCAVPALGHVVENRVLGRVLLNVLRNRGNVGLHSPLNVERLVPLADGMAVHAAGQVCRAGLVIAADGANSMLLQALGIHTAVRDYGQTALIANIGLARPHRGIAYERFTDEGPVALLPLPDAGGEHRAALVWTMAPDRAHQLVAADEGVFLDDLHRRFGYRAGRFLRCGSRASYPLQLMVAQEQVRRHLVVAGNAAHFLHPVAGQGFNLALRDVARLAEHLVAARAHGRQPGDLAVLEAYLASQLKDQRNTIRFSDGLPTLFGQGSAGATVVRNAGLVALDLLDPLRREFARFGAGLASPAFSLSREMSP